jgi:hypothetical protein
MASTSEYEQQQVWEDSLIEVILGDNGPWLIEQCKMFEEQLLIASEELFKITYNERMQQFNINNNVKEF